jgi:predicted PurR-regulated permease PerM
MARPHAVDLGNLIGSRAFSGPEDGVLTAKSRSRARPRDMNEAQFERLLLAASRLGILLIASVVVVAALMAGRVIMLPVALAIIVGLMFGPVADRVESRGISPAISAAIVVIAFLAIILGSIALFAVPLSEWVARAPLIWEKFRTELMSWREPLEALGSLQDQIKTVLGGGAAMTVSVEEGNPVTDLAFLAPAILAEILVFLVSLYFYLATREHIRVSILSLCISRRLRWRTAHVFRDVESKVSRFLLTVTMLNIGVGVVMTLATWWLGLPSPLLWGALAGVLNYIPYVGQAIMLVILFAVGMATQPSLEFVLAPIAVYIVVNFVEGQVVFPQLVGRAVTLNPFLIFLSISFWIWVWGPFGALVAVPVLLILQSFLSNVIATKAVAPRRPVRRTGRMTARDVVLANAAKAIKEQAEDDAKAAEEATATAAPPVEAPPEPKPATRRRPTKTAATPKPATA